MVMVIVMVMVMVMVMVIMVVMVMVMVMVMVIGGVSIAKTISMMYSGGDDNGNEQGDGEGRLRRRAGPNVRMICRLLSLGGIN